MNWKAYDLVYAVKNDEGQYVGKNNVIVESLIQANKYKKQRKAKEIAEMMNRFSINKFKVVKVHVVLQEEEMNE